MQNDDEKSNSELDNNHTSRRTVLAGLSGLATGSSLLGVFSNNTASATSISTTPEQIPYTDKIDEYAWHETKTETSCFSSYGDIDGKLFIDTTFAIRKAYESPGTDTRVYECAVLTRFNFRTLTTVDTEDLSCSDIGRELGDNSNASDARTMKIGVESGTLYPPDGPGGRGVYPKEIGSDHDFDDTAENIAFTLAKAGLSATSISGSVAVTAATVIDELVSGSNVATDTDNEYMWSPHDGKWDPATYTKFEALWCDFFVRSDGSTLPNVTIGSATSTPEGAKNAGPDAAWQYDFNWDSADVSPAELDPNSSNTETVQPEELEHEVLKELADGEPLIVRRDINADVSESKETQGASKEGSE
ncbi:hypothetical protein [Halobacterium hubeiense]|nr:hypothetical protein [Halobacterium hubeiense]